MIYFGAVSIEGVLFDLDGTLVQSHIDFRLMRTEVMRIAEGAGIPASSLDGREILEMVEAAAEQAAPENRAELRRAMWRRLEDMERDGCLGASAIPGAGELLIRLRRAGVKIGIVTRNCRAVSTPLLRELALSYDVMLTRDDVLRCKPNPAHLHDALAALNIAPEQSMMIGDHWLDVQAGKECGCAATVGVLGDRPPTYFDPCRPDAVAVDLNDARPLFHD